jgi:DNA modification methylase
VTQAAREKRDSLAARVARLHELVAESPEEHFLLWHDLEDERHAIQQVLPVAVAVWGSQDLQERERRIIDFSDGHIRLLAAKPVLAGSGCNFQYHCHRAVFAGIGFKFADFLQAVHRIHRFLQDRPVRIDLIYTQAEREIRAQLERKWRQHNEQVARMGEIIRAYGLSHEALAQRLRRTVGVARQEASDPDGRYLLVNNDAVEETAAMASGSVDLIVSSIPFATQYEYSPSYNDFGHTIDNAHFWQQMDYLTPQLHRVLAPGRVCVIHVKDRIVPGGLTGLGFQTVQPFHAEAITHYLGHGFAFLGMITVVTDVVRENNQTYRLGWTEQCKDGSKMGAGLPEYLLIFRKPPSDQSDGYADAPVVKSKADYSRARWQVDAHGFWRSDGDRPLTPEDLADQPAEQIFKRFRAHNLTGVYSHAEHVRLGEGLDAAGRLPSGFMLLQPPSWHPEVWTDVARMRTLNMLQERHGRQQHLCPLPFDIVDRVIGLYSMPGEAVYDPFMGLGTVPYCAVKAGRRGFGVELNPGYFADGVAYVAAAARAAQVPTLFDLLEAKDEGSQEAVQ